MPCRVRRCLQRSRHLRHLADRDRFEWQFRSKPPTRTITVTPPTADFFIAVSPPAQAVIPGQSTAFTVTVTPVAGFTGTVSLGVGNGSEFPSGVTSGDFSPASITGSGFL